MSLVFAFNALFSGIFFSTFLTTILCVQLTDFMCSLSIIPNENGSIAMTSSEKKGKKTEEEEDPNKPTMEQQTPFGPFFS